jgi:hypothetical protein
MIDSDSRMLGKGPLCPSDYWLTSYLFTCPMVEPLLARNHVSLVYFEECISCGRGVLWRVPMLLLFEVLTII